MDSDGDAEEGDVLNAPSPQQQRRRSKRFGRSENCNLSTMMEIGGERGRGGYCFDYDVDHSSEEELEVINGAPEGSRNLLSPVSAVARGVSGSALPEKRKWTEMETESGPEEVELSPDPPKVRRGRLGVYNTRSKAAAGVFGHSSGSSDDESSSSAVCLTPVKFCKSPPLHVHRPTRTSLSSPLKPINGDQQQQQFPSPPRVFATSPHPHSMFGGHLLLHEDRSQEGTSLVASSEYAQNARKRHRNATSDDFSHAQDIQRPCLDFEKMQRQMKSEITQWGEHGSDRSGELCVCCW